MNHLRTATERSSSVFASEIAAKSSGRSHQYASRRARQNRHTDRVSVGRTRELGERDGREDEWRGGQGRQIAGPGCDSVHHLDEHLGPFQHFEDVRFQERCPATLLRRRHSLLHTKLQENNGI